MFNDVKQTYEIKNLIKVGTPLMVKSIGKDLVCDHCKPSSLGESMAKYT
jgi:hypothetical protein